MNETSPTIRTCTGHKDTITCMDHHSQELLTASEDGTGRLWDLRSCKSVQCFMLSSSSTGASVATITNASFHPMTPHLIYMTSGMQVHRFDTRMNRVIHPTSQCSQFIESPGGSDASKKNSDDGDENELNGMSWNKQGTKMSLCDDSGMVYVLNMDTMMTSNVSDEKSSTTTMGAIGQVVCSFRAHENICIGTQLIKNDIQLLSAGLDYKLSLYSVNQKNMDVGRKSIWTLPFQTMQLQDSVLSSKSRMQKQINNPKQLVNPPLLQCMAVSNRYDNRVSVGLANGKCALLNVNKDLSSMVVGTIDAHSYILNQMQFIDQSDKTMLFTCGYDNVINLWDVAQFYAVEKKGKTTSSTTSSSSSKKKSKSSNKAHPLLIWSQQFPESTKTNRAHIECFKASPSTSTVLVAYDKTVAILPYNMN